MVLKMFTIYDSKLKAYMPPLYYRNSGEALRAVTMSLEKSDHPFAKFPGDYTLFEIGQFDDETGAIDQLSTPHSHGVLVELLPQRAPIQAVNS